MHDKISNMVSPIKLKKMYLNKVLNIKEDWTANLPNESKIVHLFNF